MRKSCLFLNHTELTRGPQMSVMSCCRCNSKANFVKQHPANASPEGALHCLLCPESKWFISQTSQGPPRVPPSHGGTNCRAYWWLWVASLSSSTQHELYVLREQGLQWQILLAPVIDTRTSVQDEANEYQVSTVTRTSSMNRSLQHTTVFPSNRCQMFSWSKTM